MAQPFREWTVLPHGKLSRLEDNLMCATGVLKMPMGDVDRRMTLVRLRSGRLVVYSAIALDEEQMAEIEAFGSPAYLVVPSDIHRMDARIWKERYPSMLVVAPAGARAKVEEVVHVDTTDPDFGDPAVCFVTVPGTGEGEAALVIETEGATTLVVNDIVFNLANRPGVAGWLFKTIGMTGDTPHLPTLVKMRKVKDAAALRAQLERWARLPNLRRVVISHGTIIGSEAAEVLGKIAADIAA